MKSASHRSRNAASTRHAILASARKAFARGGYDGVGLREIGAGAGVTAMMINRYFGPKEALFAEVVADVMATPIVLTDAALQAGSLGKALAAGVVQPSSTGATPLDGFLIMMHSASSSRAAAIAREQIERHYHRQLTAVLHGEHAPQRAAAVLALVAGIHVMRQVIGLTALADARPDALLEILTPAFEQLLALPARPGSIAPMRPKTKRIGLPPRSPRVAERS